MVFKLNGCRVFCASIVLFYVLAMFALLVFSVYFLLVLFPSFQAILIELEHFLFFPFEVSLSSVLLCLTLQPLQSFFLPFSPFVLTLSLVVVKCCVPTN